MTLPVPLCLNRVVRCVCFFGPWPPCLHFLVALPHILILYTRTRHTYYIAAAGPFSFNLPPGRVLGLAVDTRTHAHILFRLRILHERTRTFPSFFPSLPLSLSLYWFPFGLCRGVRLCCCWLCSLWLTPTFFSFVWNSTAPFVTNDSTLHTHDIQHTTHGIRFGLGYTLHTASHRLRHTLITHADVIQHTYTHLPFERAHTHSYPDDWCAEDSDIHATVGVDGIVVGRRSGDGGRE